MALVGSVLKGVADVAWKGFQAVNRRIPEGKALAPNWAPGPLAKSRERTKPPLGFPRETNSLCPDCVIEVRNDIIEGRRDISELTEGRPGKIKARFVLRDGKIVIEKTCEKHGKYEDLMSIDPKFNEVIESRFYGRDYVTANDEHVHHHGTSTIKYGRGAVLTVDLTNRCNMMCNPCFMDANQVGYVHELTMDDVKRILDDSISFKPRRQMSVQFSGGEPTVSPLFLDAIRYAREVGYYSVQAATNGLKFAQDPEFAKQAKEAGMDLAYFQFDGVTNEANSHRHISNLFDAKLLALENLYNAGIEAVPVTTVVNGVTDAQVGPLMDFLIENNKYFGGISFQPVSFTGRDEEITPEDRAAQRYTTSHLARDLEKWSGGKIDRHRDWFPLGVMGAFTILADYLRGPDVKFGGLDCSCHPDCGASVYLLVNMKTKEWEPISKFFDAEQFIHDIQVMTDTARPTNVIRTQILLSLLRNFDESKAPKGFTLMTLLKLINSRMGDTVQHTKDGYVFERAEQDGWKLLWVGGMWFQDLWTYDFRRTEMCVIPYGTQEGEISFCAYNTGIGWRQIIENMHMTATTSEWFKSEGRHAIYAGDRAMPLPADGQHSLKILGQDEKSACCSSGTEDRVRQILRAPASPTPESSRSEAPEEQKKAV